MTRSTLSCVAQTSRGSALSGAPSHLLPRTLWSWQRACRPVWKSTAQQRPNRRSKSPCHLSQRSSIATNANTALSIELTLPFPLRRRLIPSRRFILCLSGVTSYCQTKMKVVALKQRCQFVVVEVVTVALKYPPVNV